MVPWVIPDSGSSDHAYRNWRSSTYSDRVDWMCMGCLQSCKVRKERIAYGKSKVSFGLHKKAGQNGTAPWPCIDPNVNNSICIKWWCLSHCFG